MSDDDELNDPALHHHREAWAILRASELPDDHKTTMELIARAQVHALLAIGAQLGGMSSSL